MLPSFAKNDNDNGVSITAHSPTSPRSRNFDFNATQRKWSGLNSSNEDYNNHTYQPRRDKKFFADYFYKKGKPRRFFTPSKYRQRTRWWRFVLLLLFFAFLFGYIPLFRFTFPGPDPQRDQFLLYRIIGNDLPPRHKEGQTLSNLHFILEHEPAFPNTRKIFLLNRISDPVSEAAIINLLDHYRAEYLRIPFVESEYKQIDFRLEDFPEPDFLHSDYYRRFSKVAKLRALDYTYHDKNLYAMNNNGGRNMALEHGRSVSNVRWIMPFDGNCYLSHNAFHEIKAQLDRFGVNTKYFVVPMTRLLNNSILLNNQDDRPKAHEEPQIIFRYDANEEYNLNMRYGRRSKLELLWRLGALENRRLNRQTVAWEPMERPYSKDKGNFRTIGWVFRLFSGNQAQEESKKEASSIRAFNRLLAIQSSLDGLDESIARRIFRQDNLFLYNATELAHIRHKYWAKDPKTTAAMEELEKRAEKILEETRQQLEPLAVTDDADHLLTTAASNSTVSPASEPLGSLSQKITTMTLANYFLGNEKYGRWAANLVRVYFLNEHALSDQEDEYTSARMISDNTHLLDFLSDQGYSFPSLSRVPRVLAKYNSNRIIHATDLTKSDMSTLLDSMRLLRQAQMLTHKEYKELQATMAQVLEYLITIPTGIHLAQMTDHRGVLYDLQVTALAAFTDDVRLFLRVANRCRMRIGKQFLANGSQPYQDTAAHTKLQAADSSQQQQDALLFHYRLLNLQYWTMLARGIQNSGVAFDIWHYTAKNQGRISRAVVSHLQEYPMKTMPALAKMARDAFLYSATNDMQQREQKQQANIMADWRWIMESTLRSDDDNTLKHLFI